MLPLIIAGSLVAVISGFLASGALSRASYVVASAGLAGVAATAVLQSWLDVVGGDWAANAATLSLTVLATAAFIAGLQALLGQPGMILGALTMAFVGNLLLSTGYFDGAAAGGHVAVLVGWALAGLALLFVAALRARRFAPAVAPVPA